MSVAFIPTQSTTSTSAAPAAVSLVSTRARYAEALEARARHVEAPDAGLRRHREAPDAGESRSGGEGFTHGRSWS